MVLFCMKQKFLFVAVTSTVVTPDGKALKGTFKPCRLHQDIIDSFYLIVGTIVAIITVVTAIASVQVGSGRILSNVSQYNFIYYSTVS